MAVEIRIPPILQIGGGSFSTVAAVLLSLRCGRPLIVTDPFLMKSHLATKLATQIRDAGLSCEIFHETVADPTTTVVEAGVSDGVVTLDGTVPTLASAQRAEGLATAITGVRTVENRLSVV